MKQVPEGHPLLSIWKDLIKLFINERPPFNFILNYEKFTINKRNFKKFKNILNHLK